MSKFFAVPNHTPNQTLVQVEPWNFKPETLPSDKIRFDKPERQAFYLNPQTQWQFYTPVEPANPNLRPSKNNPPRALHGLAADYDIKLPPERITEAIASMKVKPTYIERSLGGNARLVWVFEQPILTDTYEFCAALFLDAQKWLNLDLLPGLDAGAFQDPSRLLCNGGDWHATGHGLVSAAAVQAFYVESGRRYRFSPPTEGDNLPLEVVEKALRERFPQTFDWPTSFEAESQGPSFWIEGSTSPMSAIVKPGGMFSFSAHASKPFYSWSDILGKDFVTQISEDAIAKATQDIYHDGKMYWLKIANAYRSMGKDDIALKLEVDCGLPPKKVKVALNHINIQARVNGAAPFIFRPSGLIYYQNEPVLNICMNRIMQPAESGGEWGDKGDFPFISYLLDNIFDPPEQKVHWLAWMKAFYLSGLNQKPMPGQNIFLMGGGGNGKTFLSRKIVGSLVGGFVDASSYLMGGDQFGSENFHVPLWCVDDETVSGSNSMQDRFTTLLKKVAANQQFRFNKKFHVACMVEWIGRAIVTANLDYVSSRILGPLDNTSMEKTCLFRCVREQDRIQFPPRHTLEPMVHQQLPFFARWLVNWEVPDTIARHTRYGFAAYHEPSLLDQSHQSNKSAPFKELLAEALEDYFRASPEVMEWRGTVSQLIRLMHSNPMNDFVMRSVKLEQVNRYLEQIQRENILKCSAEVGNLKTRVWVFARGDSALLPDPKPDQPISIPDNTTNNPFSNENS